MWYDFHSLLVLSCKTVKYFTTCTHHQQGPFATECKFIRRVLTSCNFNVTLKVQMKCLEVAFIFDHIDVRRKQGVLFVCFTL